MRITIITLVVLLLVVLASSIIFRIKSVALFLPSSVCNNIGRYLDEDGPGFGKCGSVEQLRVVAFQQRYALASVLRIKSVVGCITVATRELCESATKGLVWPRVQCVL